VTDASLAIEETPAIASEYTSRANLVGIVTNGAAVLSQGCIGPLTSKCR
jgi:malate dehydrogenase (oxaloacetate-decarboxylating)(NADP+)